VKRKPKLIVALDVETLEEVRYLTEALRDIVDIFKIGSQLFTACGPAAVRFVQAQDKEVFLDLKYHDIPNTVANSVKAAVRLREAVNRSTGMPPDNSPGKPGLFMYTVHTLGGVEMMSAAAKAGKEQAAASGFAAPLVVGVTVLTSTEKRDNIQALVLERALIAQKAGLSGVVASPHEAKIIRKELGKDFVIVTPGIRPEGFPAGDQKRIATPGDAIQSGSDFLVVGRPIVKADNPVAAAKNILESMNKA